MEEKEKKKKTKSKKETVQQLITAAVIAALALLLLNVLSVNRDGRRQVVDQDGAEEYLAETESQAEEERRLAEILSQMKGVGQVEVMMTWQEPETVSVFSSGGGSEERKVKGVMIAAEGASNAVVRDKIISAVSAVFDLSPANVMVFEKESGGNEK